MTIEEFRKHKCYLYAIDVVNGDVIAPKYIIKECGRFLEMIDNPKSEFYKKYFIDLDMAYKVDGFIRLMNFSTGEYAGQPCHPHIMPFQWYILMNIYAVKLRSNPQKRRYEKACIYISRKNAKTWIISALDGNCLYLFFKKNKNSSAKLKT